VFRKQIKLNLTKVSKKNKSIALQDPLTLLLKLGTTEVDVSDMSDASLLSIVSTVLKRLDIDGDGRVSW
jgi:hypothetical protein